MMKRQTKKIKALPSSYKDPSGFIYKKEGVLFRQVNHIYKAHYDHLMNSGLYKQLVSRGILIPHKETGIKNNTDCYKTLQPENIKFISYPYEWCFSAYKEAALTTLEIQKTAMDFGMTLKDASAYNMAFHKGKFVLIDTLSFEKNNFQKPWVAYRQFCMHFLAPLSLMAYRDERMVVLMKHFINGLPLDLTDTLLPMRAKINLSLMAHIKSHILSNRSTSESNIRGSVFGKNRFGGIIDSLCISVDSLNTTAKKSGWSDYYEETNYSKAAAAHKLRLINNAIKKISPSSIWDFGSNSGYYSSSEIFKKADIVQFDNDFNSVEKAYTEIKSKNHANSQVLFLDLFNPSSDMGWANEERLSLIKRGPADLVLALALIHHLVVGNNLNFSQLAEFFHKTGKNLIIEFVPTNDSNFAKIMGTRGGVFKWCTQKNFENVFLKHFRLVGRNKIMESKRWLYAMVGR